MYCNLESRNPALPTLLRPAPPVARSLPTASACARSRRCLPPVTASPQPRPLGACAAEPARSRQPSRRQCPAHPQLLQSAVELLGKAAATYCPRPLRKLLAPIKPQHAACGVRRTKARAPAPWLGMPAMPVPPCPGPLPPPLPGLLRGTMECLLLCRPSLGWLVLVRCLTPCPTGRGRLPALRGRPLPFRSLAPSPAAALPTFFLCK